jgi:hypothetical protein
VVSVYDGSLIGSLFRLALALGVFVLPGFLWATWLIERKDEQSPILAARWALGFAVSFTVFAFLAWPFLWYRRSIDEFLAVLYPVWTCFSLVTAAVHLARLSKRKSDSNQKDAGNDARDSAELLATTHANGHSLGNAVRSDWEQSPSWRRSGLVGYAVGVLGLIYVYYYFWWLRGFLFVMLPFVFLAGLNAVRRIPPKWLSALDYNEDDHRKPPRLWGAVAVGAVAIQILLAGIYSRPDWDDCYYLAAALDYEHASALNGQEPTHREGLPVPTQHRTLCWELWGSLLARLTGLSPVSLFRTLLPMGLLILAYGAYAGLFRELVPRRWVPLAVIGISAVHLWGISSNGSAGNFALARLGQAKSVLLHISTPLTIMLALRFAPRPNKRTWAALLISALFGLGLSLSAIFMMSALLGSVALALAWHCRTVRERSQVLVRISLAACPLLIAGLAIRKVLRHEVGFMAIPMINRDWLSTFVSHCGRGTAEILWFLTLPFLFFMLRNRHARSYLLVFPALLLISLLNPFMFDIVAGSLTSYHTYSRLLWLLPVGPGLGVLLALTCRFVDRALPCGPPPGGRPHRALVLAVLCVVASLALPGIYVFGPSNDFLSPLGIPQLADNIEKIPAELAAIAARLAKDARVSDGRILCNEQIASFLTSYSTAFRFVQTRSLYTPLLFAAAGRRGEGIERCLLASVLRRGRVPLEPDRDDWLELRILFGEEALSRDFGAEMGRANRDVRTLCNRYEVTYVVTGPGDRIDGLFDTVRLRATEIHHPFALWQRSPD